MDTWVWIVLIVAVAVIVVLFMFRDKLGKFFLKAGHDGIETGLETREPGPGAPPDEPGRKPYGVNISGNKQVGAGNQISVAQSDVNVSDNTQAGRDQTIEVKPSKK